MGYAPPPLQSNSSSSQQGSSNLASSAMVAHPIESSSQQPCVTSTQSTPHAESLRSKQGTSNVPSPSFDRVSNLQQYYQTEGFPGQVTKLLLSATRVPLERPTNQHGPAGVVGVLKGKFIVFQPHSQKFLSF